MHFLCLIFSIHWNFFWLVHMVQVNSMTNVNKMVLNVKILFINFSIWCDNFFLLVHMKICGYVFTWINVISVSIVIWWNFFFYYFIFSNSEIEKCLEHQNLGQLLAKINNRRLVSQLHSVRPALVNRPAYLHSPPPVYLDNPQHQHSEQRHQHLDKQLPHNQLLDVSQYFNTKKK